MALSPKKTKYSLTLDTELVENIKSYSPNLSKTVNELLLKMVEQIERQDLKLALKEYEKEAKSRRRKIGVFSDIHRRFL